MWQHLAHKRWQVNEMFGQTHTHTRSCPLPQPFSLATWQDNIFVLLTMLTQWACCKTCKSLSQYYSEIMHTTGQPQETRLWKWACITTDLTKVRGPREARLVYMSHFTLQWSSLTGHLIISAVQLVTSRKGTETKSLRHDRWLQRMMVLLTSGLDSQNGCFSKLVTISPHPPISSD